MSYEPELRPGPPWIMEEMIWAEPELPVQVAGSKDADRLASHIRTAVDAGEPILFTGCGTSEHASFESATGSIGMIVSPMSLRRGNVKA